MVPSCGQGYACSVHHGLLCQSCLSGSAASFYLQCAAEKEFIKIKIRLSMLEEYLAHIQKIKLDSEVDIYGNEQ